MKVLALTRYSAIAASARYRFYDLQLPLRARGIDLTISPLLPDTYVRTLKVRSVDTAREIASAYVRRIGELRARGQWDLLLIQYEALPFVPPMLETMLLTGGAPFVLDYDDAWFHRYDSHGSRLVRQVLREKIPALMSRARAVVAGSGYLADFARRFNDRVAIIPTAIDLRKYPVEQRPQRVADQPGVIGWVGSPATTRYLELVKVPLLEVMHRTGARLRLVGADPSGVQIAGAEVVPWQADTEIAELNGFDVGIMPLADEPVARGKCAFKLIQYMGAWKPTVASPIGENTTVVADGESGLLARSDGQWREALLTLLGDRALSATFGRVGRRRVEEAYDQQGAATRLADLLHAVNPRVA